MTVYLYSEKVMDIYVHGCMFSPVCIDDNYSHLGGGEECIFREGEGGKMAGS